MNQEKLSAKISQSFIFWIISGLLAMFIVFLLPWRFQVNDDVIMMWLVSGSFTGEPENYAVFIHPILSYGLSAIYRFEPSIHWYGIFQYFLIFTSFATCTFLIQNNGNLGQGKVLYQVLLFLLSIHLCFFPQFTLVAGWSAFSALLLAKQYPTSKRTLVFSVALLFCSGILRAEASALIWLGFAWFMLADFQKSKILPLAIFLGFLLTLIGTKILWENQSDYQEYLEFNKARHRVIDHPVFYQNKLEMVYTTDPIWKHFSNWFIQESPPTKSDLNQHYKELNSQYFSVNHLLLSLNRLMVVHLMELFKSFLAFSFILLYWIHFRRNKKMLLLALVWIFFFLVFNHFNHIRGRVVFLFYLPLLIPILDKSLYVKNKLTFGLILSVLGLFFCIHIFNFTKDSQLRKSYLSQYESLLAKKPSLSPIYLEGFPLEYFSKYYDGTESIPFFIEGWIAKSPFQTKAYRRLGFEKLGEFDRYYLLGVKEKTPFDFPYYMNSIGKEYSLIDSLKTSDLVLFEFSRK